MDLYQLAIQLSETSYEGCSFETLLLPGEEPVLQVIVEDAQELPIFVTATEDQLLCVTNLFRQAEVRPEQIAEMHVAMLELNVPMPLTAFAKVDDQYMVFGALSINSRFEEIAHELVTQADNAIDALETLQEFLL
jgi:uncharacterized protein YjfI (DUF2170 family)